MRGIHDSLCFEQGLGRGCEPRDRPRKGHRFSRNFQKASFKLKVMNLMHESWLAENSFDDVRYLTADKTITVFLFVFEHEMIKN